MEYQSSEKLKRETGSAWKYSVTTKNNLCEQSGIIPNPKGEGEVQTQSLIFN